jgi:hypothetical protein
MLKANSRIIHLHQKAPSMREGAGDNIYELELL